MRRDGWWNGSRNPIRRTILLIVTKIGRYMGDDGIEYDFGPDRAVRSVHESLEELGLEHLPVLKVHDARPDHWDQIMAPNGMLAALRRLQAEGLVGAIGTAVGNADFAAMAAESGEFDIIGSYHHYTLLNQDAARRIHPHARQYNLGVINISPFGGNILGTGAIQGARYSYREAAPEVLNEVRDMEERAQAHGLDPANGGPGLLAGVPGYQRQRGRADNDQGAARGCGGAAGGGRVRELP